MDDARMDSRRDDVPGHMCRNDAIASLEGAVHPHPALTVVRPAGGEEVAEVTPSPSTPCVQPTDIGPATGGRATQSGRPLGRSRTRSGATPGTVGSPHPELTFARFT
jgi:hypothetical protein